MKNLDSELWAGSRVVILGQEAKRVRGILRDWIGRERLSVGSAQKPIYVILDGEALGAASPSSIDRLASHVILNLEDLALVRLSNELSVPVSWVSRRDPRELLGALVDRFEGGYFRRFPDLQLVYSTASDFESLRVPPGVSRDPAVAAAFVVAKRLGIRPRLDLLSALDESPRHQPQFSQSI